MIMKALLECWSAGCLLIHRRQDAFFNLGFGLMGG